MAKEWTYAVSHPWMKFHADLSQIPYDVWVMLGECQSKIEHLAGAPLLPESAQKFYHVYLAKGVHATTAIEGNTLSEADVMAGIKGTLKVPPSQEYLKTEVQNVIDACNGICNAILSSEATPRLCGDEIKEYNRLVLNGLPMKDGGVAGEISPFMVGVNGYRGAPRQECDYLLNRLCEWLEEAFVPTGELDAGIAILQAVLAHLYIAWIHPFADGNGRTARLMEFRILLARGVPSPASHLLSNHYNKTRAEYYRQLGEASGNGGDVREFIRYAVQGFRDGLREQINRVREQQLEIVWRNHIHEKFRARRSESDKRRRDLVIAISKHGGVIPRAHLRGLTPELAQEYALLTERALSRDLNQLRDMELVSRGPRGYRARKHLIQAFLPRRRTAKRPPPQTATELLEAAAI